MHIGKAKYKKGQIKLELFVLYINNFEIVAAMFNQGAAKNNFLI